MSGTTPSSIDSTPQLNAHQRAESGIGPWGEGTDTFNAEPKPKKVHSPRSPRVNDDPPLESRVRARSRSPSLSPRANRQVDESKVAASPQSTETKADESNVEEPGQSALVDAQDSDMPLATQSNNADAIPTTAADAKSADVAETKSKDNNHSRTAQEAIRHVNFHEEKTREAFAEPGALEEFWLVWQLLCSTSEPTRVDGSLATRLNELLSAVFKDETPMDSALGPKIPALTDGSTMDDVAEVLLAYIRFAMPAYSSVRTAVNTIFFKITTLRDAVWAPPADSKTPSSTRISYALEQLFQLRTRQGLSQRDVPSDGGPLATVESCLWLGNRIDCPIHIPPFDPEFTDRAPAFSVTDTLFIRNERKPTSSVACCERFLSADGPGVHFVLAAEAQALSANDITPSIFFCVETGDESGLKEHLIGQRADPNVARLKNGDTPLILAAAHNQPGMARLLLDCGADKEKRNATGDRALNLSIRNRFAEVTEVLSFHQPKKPKALLQSSVKAVRNGLKRLKVVAGLRKKAAKSPPGRQTLPNFYTANLNPSEVCSTANSPVMKVSIDDYLLRAELAHKSGARATRALVPEISGQVRQHQKSTVLLANVEVPKPGPGGPAYRKPQLAQTQQVRLMQFSCRAMPECSRH